MKFIRSYFDKLFKIKESTENDSLFNIILFQIDENQKVHLKVNIDNFSEEAAKKFGFLLFLLNEGYYVQTFMDLISDFSKESLTKAQFCQQVIGSWSNKIAESDKYELDHQDEPMIKPTSFNNAKS